MPSQKPPRNALEKTLLPASFRSQTPKPTSLNTRVPIGWKEWAALPLLGRGVCKAKIDTGARTSALHVDLIEPLPGLPDMLRILLPLHYRRSLRQIEAHVQVADYVLVRNSSGKEELRPMIQTTLQLGEHFWQIRLGLTDRGEMFCPMLLGRTALQDRFAVVPEAAYLLGQPSRTARRAASLR